MRYNDIGDGTLISGALDLKEIITIRQFGREIHSIIASWYRDKGTGSVVGIARAGRGDEIAAG